MKILHVTPSVADVRGGVSQAVLEMIGALQVHNVNAQIATTNDNGLETLDVPLGYFSQYRHVPVQFFPRFSPNSAAVREYAVSREFTVWLWQNIQRYDVLHVHALFSYVPTVAMAIARLKKVPYVISPHGLLCQWSRQQSAAKKQVYLELAERGNLNHSSALLLNSSLEQEEIADLGLAPPMLTIPHGLHVPDQIPDARRQLRERAPASLG